MKLIPLTQGKFAQVDDEDFDFINQWKWLYHLDSRGFGYARRREHQPSRKMIAMHRVIMGATDEQEIDHKDGDRLNNQRYNLRFNVGNGNNCNARIRKDNTSGYKGVSFHKATGQWQSRVYVNGEPAFYALYPTALLAAKAYNRAAKQHHGEFARLNII